MIRYGYFKVELNNKMGYITVAMERPPKGTGPQKHYASFAFCSPKDMFKKEHGRKASAGRLQWGMGAVVADKNTQTVTNRISRRACDIVSFEYQGNIQKAFVEALNLAFSKGMVPHWVVRSSRKNGIQFGLRSTKSESKFSLVFDEGSNSFSVTEDNKAAE